MTRRLMSSSMVVAGFVLAMAGIQVIAQTADPLAGTWVLNTAKSKYASTPAPKSETRSYTIVGQELKATSKGTDAAGKPTSGEWTVNYDGKDQPTTGDPNVDALSFKRIDTHSGEFTQKKAGTVVATGTRVISKDGKTMTITTKGTNAKGQPYLDVEVFDKR